MNLMKNVLSVTVLSAVVLFTGCRSSKVPLTPVQQGALIGGAGGGTVGAIWAHSANNGAINGLEGAGYGVVAGVAAGALIGDALDEYAYDNAAGLKDKEAQINDLQRQLSSHRWSGFQRQGNSMVSIDFIRATAPSDAPQPKSTGMRSSSNVHKEI